MNELGPRPSHPATACSLAVDIAPLEGRLTIDYPRNVNSSKRGEFQCPRLGQLGQHTLFMGATGSGKTTALKLHIKSALCPIPARSGFGNVVQQAPYAMNFRALIYDAKTDLVPFLAGIGFDLERHVILTNPFDSRSVAWDVSADVDSYPAGETFAEILVQSHKGSDSPFWQTACRDIVASAIHGLNQKQDGRRVRWTFRHLTEVLLDHDHLRTVLERTDNGRSCLRYYLDADAHEMRDGIWATLRNNIKPHRLAAAAWHKSSQSFSFRDWERGGGIVLIGDDYENEEAASRVNNLLVRYAIRTALGHPGEVHHTTTWFYLDELKRAGRFPAFSTMLTQGRSKGIRAVLTAQGLSTFTAAFEESDIPEVLNNCAEKCIMQLSEPDDAEWAERLFSSTRRMSVSTTRSAEDNKHSYTSSVQEEPKLVARKFYELKSAQDTERGLDAYFHMRGGEHAHTTVHSAWVNRRLARVSPARTTPEAFAKRCSEDFVPEPLTLPEQHYLGLRAVPPSLEATVQGAAGARSFRLPPPPTNT